MSDSEQLTIIGRGAHIKGEVTFDTPARVMGTIEGRIIAKTDLYIGETARCLADVQGTRFYVDGVVEGSIHATDQIELSPKCCVKGDVTAATLIVTEGASLMGYCRVGPDAMNQPMPYAKPAMQAAAATAPQPVRPAADTFIPETFVSEKAAQTEKTAAKPASVMPERHSAERPIEVKTPARPRARTADWLPPAMPAFPSLNTAKPAELNGSI